jgi:hypothetical protein
MDPMGPQDTEHEDRKRRIEELKEQIQRISGIPDCVHISPDCPEGIAQSFLQQVLDFETRQERPLFDALVECGVPLPAPEDVPDEQLHARLWEVIHAMARLGHYLHNTDHLSDHELYLRLWNDTLREPTTIVPECPSFACHIDLVGSGSDEDLQIYLKHYAEEGAREQWACDWPEDAIPPHEDPPYDRDRFLPGCEF